MKKRQRKKNEKKYITIYVDEFNLITMTDEERKQAWDDYLKYRKKYAFRKRYKDLKTSKPLMYIFPPSQSMGSFISEISKRSRKGNQPGTTVYQNQNDFIT